MGTPGGFQPWITEQTSAAPDGGEDAIVVEPRSTRLLVAAIVVMSMALVAFVVVRAGTSHQRQAALAPALSHTVPKQTLPTATATLPNGTLPTATLPTATLPNGTVPAPAPPVGGTALSAEASRLCRPAPCRVDVLDPPVLGWFEAAFPDAVEGDGYAAYASAGLSVFVTHLYLDHAVTVLCLGRRVRGREAPRNVPSEVNAKVGVSVFNTTLSIRRDGWEVTITITAGQRPTVASQSARTWLKNAVLP